MTTSRVETTEGDGNIAPWRCRHGWHSWSFVEMSDHREIDGPRGVFWVCRLVERCRRCPIVRTNPNATKPVRIRT